MITQLCKLPDNRCIAPLKWVNVTVLKLYLDNTLKILWEGRRIEGLQPGKVDPPTLLFPRSKAQICILGGISVLCEDRVGKKKPNR